MQVLVVGKKCCTGTTFIYDNNLFHLTEMTMYVITLTVQPSIFVTWVLKALLVD